METRKWQLEVTKGGKRQYVYWITNDEVHARDNAAKDKGGSLAELAKRDNSIFSNQLSEEDLLVFGVRSYLATTGYHVGDIQETDLIPPGLPENWVGGWDGNYAFCLHFEDIGITL